MDPRNQKRLLAKFPLFFTWDLCEGGGELLDLSTNGCRIRSEVDLNCSKYLRLILHTPNDDTPIKIELAAVRWITGEETGVEFIRVSSAHKKRLKELIALLERSPEIGKQEVTNRVLPHHKASAQKSSHKVSRISIQNPCWSVLKANWDRLLSQV